MPQINLNILENEFCPTYYPLLLDYSHRYEIYMGSAGSAKSYFITQKIIVRCLREQIKVLVCRRYGTTIRNTCFSLFKEILQKWEIAPYLKIRETDFNIKFPNGSEIIFSGLDEETTGVSMIRNDNSNIEFRILDDENSKPNQQYEAALSEIETALGV